MRKSVIELLCFLLVATFLFGKTAEPENVLTYEMFFLFAIYGVSRLYMKMLSENIDAGNNLFQFYVFGYVSWAAKAAGVGIATWILGNAAHLGSTPALAIASFYGIWQARRFIKGLVRCVPPTEI